MDDSARGDDQKKDQCNGPDPCARSPHLGCMCGAFGRFAYEKTEWHSEGLRVHLTQYEGGAIWILIYGHAALDSKDIAFLDEIVDLATEAEVSWTSSVPVVAPGARLHGYGVMG